MAKTDSSSVPADAPVTKTRSPRSTKPPTKNLPTSRISVPKQIEIIRAYAGSYEALSRPVTNAEVGEVVGMTGNTVSLANAFFVATGILERSEGGYVPSAEAKAFLHYHGWNPDAAATKLAPLLQKAWFTLALMPKLRFRSLDEEEAITDLATAAEAAPEYKVNLRMILEYLEATRIIARENGTIRLAAQTEQNGECADAPERQAPKTPPTNEGASNPPDLSTSFVRENGGGVSFSINVNIPMTELRHWSGDRIAALFKGAALVVAAKNDRELKEIEQDVG
jgi:hypothetical protein